MDSFQAAVTSLSVIAILALMVVLVCHYLGPRTTAWFRSNREEKIGLSKNKLFNANGYMIHSGSEFLLSTSGSFKRFDSIDRDYTQVDEQSIVVVKPTWNIPANDFPPQPLRPAPTPPQICTKIKQANEKRVKQKSFEAESVTAAIPRPVTKRQLSTPTKLGYSNNNINTNNNNNHNNNNPNNNISSAQNIFLFKQLPSNNKSSRTKMHTNPFLNGSLAPLPENIDNLTIKRDRSNSLQCNHYKEEYEINVYSMQNRNPFTADCLRRSRPQMEIEKEEYNSVSPREPPKTDIDRRKVFDFEPERVTSILDSQQQLQFLQQRMTISSCYKDSVSDSELVPEQISSSSSSSSATAAATTTTTMPVLFTKNQSSSAKDLNNKYADSPCADAFENIEKMLKKHFRNRSFSETEATEPDLQMIAKNHDYFKTGTTNPFLDENSMHKTFSENYLARNNYQTWSFSRTLSRQESNPSLLRYNNSSQSSLEGSMDSIHLQRAISCDSVSSESSVVLADLEQPVPPVTGCLCVGLQYDKNSITDSGVELVVTVMEAKELIGPPNVESFDTFVRIYLVPDESAAMQTKLFKNSTCPSYNETFCFWLNKKRTRHSLWFHLYHSGNAHTLIGEAEMQICDVTRPITTWLALSDSRQNNASWGELMFSLSYLPTAERLTVVVVKARNLNLDQEGRNTIDLQNIFVKVYLLKNDKKVSKKKTSLKRSDRCPIFNESMIFSIPPYVLNAVQVRLTVMCICDSEMIPIGHVIVGGNTTGKGVRHWHQMLTSLRKPVAMWHALRRTIVKGKNNIT